MRGLLLVAVALFSTAAFAFGDAPEISRSLGKKGGVVVLWPRVSAKSDAKPEDVARVQAALVQIARGVSDKVDVRPEPERVCPKETGCKAVALGAAIAASGQGCAVIATVSPPGTSPAKLVPWVGELTLTHTTAPFRSPPEALMTITDFTPCSDLATALDAGASKVSEALKAALE
jgi:hypothetical protein